MWLYNLNLNTPLWQTAARNNVMILYWRRQLTEITRYMRSNVPCAYRCKTDSYYKKSLQRHVYKTAYSWRILITFLRKYDAFSAEDRKPVDAATGAWWIAADVQVCHTHTHTHTRLPDGNISLCFTLINDNVYDRHRRCINRAIARRQSACNGRVDKLSGCHARAQLQQHAADRIR